MQEVSHDGLPFRIKPQKLSELLRPMRKETAASYYGTGESCRKVELKNEQEPRRTTASRAHELHLPTVP